MGLEGFRVQSSGFGAFQSSQISCFPVPGLRALRHRNGTGET